MDNKISMVYYVKKENEINNKVIDNSSNTLKPLLNIIKNKSYKEIIIYATGSSANAANSARLYMQNILQIPVSIKEPSLAKSYEMILSDDSLYLAISQGGHSYSTIELVKEIQLKGYDIFAITSDMNSPIAKDSKNVLDIGMGIEKVPFVTAGQTATVIYLWLIALNIALIQCKLSEDDYDIKVNEIRDVVSKADIVIKKTDEWYEKEKEELLKAKRFVAISYGAGYGVVKEAETKFTETVRVPSHGHELEEYMHGPYIGLNKDDYIFCVSINGKLEKRLLLLKSFLDRHVAHTYMVSTSNNGYGEHDLNFGLNIDEFLAPILATIPFHMISSYLSQEHGIDLGSSSYPDFDEILKSKV